MGLSLDELNFQRLLLRSRKLCRDDLHANLPRLRKAVDRLQLLFISLQGDRNVDTDLIMQYGRDLQQMRLIVEADSKATVQEKLSTIEKMPKQYGTASGIRKRHVSSDYMLGGSATIAAETSAVYRADLRRQLLGDEKQNDQTKSIEEHEVEQETLTAELLRLTTEMKRNFAASGSIIREDNLALDEMQSLTDSNKANLTRESKRLEHHAYKSCVDCMFVLVVLAVIFSFVGMVLVMRVFPKRY